MALPTIVWDDGLICRLTAFASYRPASACLSDACITRYDYIRLADGEGKLGSQIVNSLRRSCGTPLRIPRWRFIPMSGRPPFPEHYGESAERSQIACSVAFRTRDLTCTRGESKSAALCFPICWIQSGFRSSEGTRWMPGHASLKLAGPGSAQDEELVLDGHHLPRSTF